jgi:hypothetical protein
MIEQIIQMFHHFVCNMIGFVSLIYMNFKYVITLKDFHMVQKLSWNIYMFSYNTVELDCFGV